MQSDNPDLSSLLQRLAIGATEPVFSPDEWATRLGAAALAPEFLAQLRREWLPASPPDSACAQVMEGCRAHLAEWHSGWPNLWAHILRVAGYALALAPEAKISPAEAFLVAVLHDVGKFDELREGVPHEEIALQMAYQLLADQVDPLVITNIADAVSKQSEAPPAYARLLTESDKLDKIGATGIVRRVSQVLDVPNAIDALRRIEVDLEDFPALKFTTARQLGATKQIYTEQFLLRLNAAPI